MMRLLNPGKIYNERHSLRLLSAKIPPVRHDTNRVSSENVHKTETGLK